MGYASKALESLKLIGDWSKWLITIEMAAIAIIGTFFTSTEVGVLLLVKILGICSIVCFVLSIISAAMLLWTLPEIAQNLRADVNIWLTKDSVAGRLFRLNTQNFAVMESLFFILGVLLLTTLIIAIMWSR